MTDPINIEEIRARCEAATPEPWRYDGQNFIWAGDGQLMVAETRGFGADLPIDNNGYFIAHARQDIPSLIAEVESLRNEVKWLRKEYRDFMGEWPE